MLDWLKNKKYPEFWKAYLQQNEQESSRYVTLKIQTTGLNLQKDVILTLGALGIEDNKIVINDSFEVVLLQYVYNHDHGLSNEFIVEAKTDKYPEAQGIEKLILFLSNAKIIGYRTDFEVEMINRALSKMECGKLKNEVLDLEVMFKKWKESIEARTISIPEIASALKIPPHENDMPLGEVYTMALCFLKLKKYLGLD